MADSGGNYQLILLFCHQKLWQMAVLAGGRLDVYKTCTF